MTRPFRLIADDTQNATGAPTLCSPLRRLSRFSCRLASRMGLDLGGGCLDRLLVHGRVELAGEGDEAAQGCDPQPPAGRRRVADGAWATRETPYVYPALTAERTNRG